jgi:hypothetical protein
MWMDYVHSSMVIKKSRLLLFHVDQMMIGLRISLRSEHPMAPMDRKAVNPREPPHKQALPFSCFLTVTNGHEHIICHERNHFRAANATAGPHHSICVFSETELKNSLFVQDMICQTRGSSISFEIDSELTHIASNAFSFCHSLTSMIFPCPVQYIDNWAFSRSCAVPLGESDWDIYLRA